MVIRGQNMLGGGHGRLPTNARAGVIGPKAVAVNSTTVGFELCSPGPRVKGPGSGQPFRDEAAESAVRAAHSAATPITSARSRVSST